MRLTHLATMLVALVYGANTFADCDAFRHLEGIGSIGSPIVMW